MIDHHPSPAPAARLWIGLTVLLLSLGALSLWWPDASEVQATKAEAGTEPVAKSRTEPIQLAPATAAKTTDEHAGEPPHRQLPDAASVIDPSDVVVRILDHHRRPLSDFPLVVSNDPKASQRPDQEQFRLHRTNAEGIAIFKRLRTTLDQDQARAKPWFIVHDVCFEHRPRIELDSAALAQDILVSIQPPFGAVELIAATTNDTPVPLAEALLEIVTAGEKDDPTTAWHRPSCRRGMQAGRARFGFVELGKSLAATVKLPGAALGSKQGAAGPRRSGELVTVHLTVGLDHPVLEYRAVDEQGTPLANTSLKVTLHRNWGGTDEPQTKTDAAGRFSVDCQPFGGFLGHKRISVTLLRDGKQLRSGSAVIPSRLETGINDGGDLVLRRPAPLVSGRAFDAAGTPLPNIIVRAGRDVSHRGHDARPWHFGHHHDVAATTDKDGGFVIHGNLPVDSFRVWADDRELRSDAVAARRGQTGIRLDCYRICNPMVEVLLAPGGKWDGTVIRLRPAGSSDGGVSTVSASQTGTTVRTSLAPVRPGRYDLSWEFQGRLLGRRPNLLIDRSGKIATIDLRRSLHPFTIILDRPGIASSQPLRGTLRWRANTTDKWQSIRFDKQTISFFSLASTVEIQILAAGYQVETLSGVLGSRRITLRRGVRVRLRLDTTGKLPAHPYIFDPAPQIGGHSVGEAVGSPYFTAEKREAVFILPPGDIVVTWHLERRMKNGAVGGEVLGQHRVKIHVTESAGEQVFTLNLDGAALDQLLQHPPW